MVSRHRITIRCIKLDSRSNELSNTTNFAYSFGTCWELCYDYTPNSYIYRIDSTPHYVNISVNLDINVIGCDCYIFYNTVNNDSDWKQLKHYVSTQTIANDNITLNNLTFNQDYFGIKTLVTRVINSACCFISDVYLKGSLAPITTSIPMTTTKFIWYQATNATVFNNSNWTTIASNFDAHSSLLDCAEGDVYWEACAPSPSESLSIGYISF